MSCIIASCGCEIGPDSREFQITLGDFDRDGDPILNYLTVCENCKNFYSISRQILSTSQEESEWLDNF